MTGLMMVLLKSFSSMVSMVLVLWGFMGKVMSNKMSAELHFRNLILGINCFTISTLNS